MKLFKRKKRKENISGIPDMHEVTLTKIFPHTDLLPIDYKHTKKFYLDGLDPLTHERERLKGMPADWLMHEKRIPAIKADSHLEIELGKKQLSNHLYTIQTIVDLQNGDIAHAQCMIASLEEEIAGYDAEISRLSVL